MGALERYLRTLTGDTDLDGRFLEVRWRLPAGMGQQFIPATDVDTAARLVRRLGAERDTYVGVALRDRRSGGRDAVSRSRVLFVEVDAQAARALLDRAPRPPSMALASGSPGHLHAYWLLSEAVSGPEVKSANRKLAYRVGGDLASVDETRILRPPETRNFKHDPPRAVELRSLHPERVYDLRALLRGLEDPPGRTAPAPPPVARALRLAGEDAALDAQLRAIPTVEYVRALTGLEANRERKVSCPFGHEDRTPSLHCYEDGTFCCFGCRRGGTIFDFAAALWGGMDTKGRAFVELRARLADELGLTPNRRSPRRPRPVGVAMTAFERQRVAGAAADRERGGR